MGFRRRKGGSSASERDYRVLERRKSQPEQAAARSQFALFDKGRALRLMLLNLRWMGKAKDSAKRGLRKASRYQLSVLGYQDGARR